MKGRKKGKGRKPKPRYLWLLLLVGFLPSCAVLDAITGADDPEVLAGTKESPVKSFTDEVEDVLPPPWGWIIAAVGGAGSGAYLSVRRKQKQAEATA